jgi:RHS repeat-associated protein
MSESTISASVPVRAGRHRRGARRGRNRGPVALGVSVVLALSYAVVTAATAPRVGAAEVPPGGLMPSAANFGWTQGQFSVSDDGAAQYTLPLWVPPGRGAVAPELSLSYNSRSGNGLVGVGWSLTGLSSISWCSRTFAQDGYTDGGHLDGADPLCLGGNRLIPVGAPQLPQRDFITEQATFARITAFGTEDNVPDYFKVLGKDGKILTFGETTDARLQAYRLEPKRDPANPGQPDGENPDLVRESTTRATVAWALNKVEDRNGNASTVTYARAEGGQAGLWWTRILPSRISYAPNRRVDFAYESRPDPVDGFASGAHTRLDVRLSRIEMWAGPQGGTAEKLREYRLAYPFTSITGRSLLTSVVECDRDGACKLPLELEWSRGSHEFEETQADLFGGGSHLTVGDVDGDARDDLIYMTQESAWVKRSTGTGFSAPIQSAHPAFVHVAFALRPVDVNADGRTELMSFVNTNPGVGPWRWTLYDSTGQGFVPAPGGGLGDLTSGPTVADDSKMYFGDLDGNGLPDFAGSRRLSSGDSTPWSYRLNTGTAGSGRFGQRQATSMLGVDFEHNFAVDTDGDGRTELITPRGLPRRSWHTLGLNAGGGVEHGVANVWGLFSGFTSFGDVNGDGLDDAFVDAGRAQLNSGNGFSARLPTPPDWFSTSRGGVRLVDFNNDGREDLLVFKRLQGDPHGTALLYVWKDNGFVRTPMSQELHGTFTGWEDTLPLDIDGDGVLDLVHLDVGPDSNDDRLRVFRRLGGVPDRLTGIGNGTLGPRVEIEYTNLANREVHTPGTCTYPLTCLARGGSVVARHKVANFVGSGEGAWDRYDHTYKAARADLHGRGWLGFAEHAVTRFWTGESTVTQFDNVHRDPGTKTYPFAHRPSQMTYTANDTPQGRLFRRTVTNSYAIRGTVSYTVELRSSVRAEAERPVDATTWQTLRTNTTTSTFDDFGNPDVVTSTTTGGRRLTEDTDYRNDTNAWLIGLPTRSMTTGCSSAGACVTRESTFDYDGSGNPTVAVVEPNQPALKSTTTTAYGEFGTVTSVTRADGAGNQRRDTFEFGHADKLFPTATINAAGHRTSIETHSGLGVPLRTTDPNGVPTTMRYDMFGRPREVHRADGSFERLSHLNFLGAQVTTVDVSGGGQSQVIVDRLGREIERRVRTFDGRTATTYTSHDFLGRGVRQVSRPALSGETRQFTTTEYDNRGRVTRMAAADGAEVRYEYVNRETHAFDGKGVESYAVASVDGDVESSFEDDPNSTAWLRTRFEYGPFGEATKVVAPGGTSQSMGYDRLGRRTSLVDPSTGTTSTTYNAFGDMLTETNGAGTTATYQYDTLGRIARISSPDGPTTYTWDTAANGLGKLASADSPDNVFTRYNYNTVGQQTLASWKIDNVTYQINTAYDGVGRPSSITYPNIPEVSGRLQVTYTYNPHGYLEQVKDAAPNGQVFWTALGRNGAGQLTKERQGDEATGVVTDYTYQPTTGLLQNITATGPGDVGQVGTLDYGYDPNRNVTLRHDRVNKRYEVYEHDTLNRLTRWHTLVPGPGYVAINGTYAYDRIGNLKTETFQRQGQARRTSTYGHGENGAPPHALTSANSQTYGYDGAGRQTSGPQRTATYNRHGLPKVLEWGQSGRTRYGYDADGNRALNRDDGQTVIYAGGLFERYTPAGHASAEIHNVHNIVVDGRVVAQVNRAQAATGGPITATRVFYLHSDLQGSTTMVTNIAGRPVGSDEGFLAHQFYDPFGHRVDDNYEPLGRNRHGSPRQGFTGHEMEDQIGIINMKGRIYDPALRRFLTPDPEVANPLSSQHHNRYSYVQNNPTTLFDPSGYQSCVADPNEVCPPTPAQVAEADAAVLEQKVVRGDPLKDELMLAATSIRADDEAGAAQTAGTVIEVTGTVRNINNDVFGEGEGVYWVNYASGDMAFYGDRESWLRAQHGSQVFRSPGSEKFYRATGTLGTIMGGAVQAANIALYATGIYGVGRAMLTLGGRALVANIAARGTVTIGRPIPGAAGASITVPITGGVEMAGGQITVTVGRNALPVAVVAQMEAGGAVFPAAGGLATNINPAPLSLAGRWSFFGRHAEGEAMLQGYYAGVRGGEGTLWVSMNPCGFCVSDISGMARTMGFDRLTVWTPDGLFGVYTPATGLKLVK